MAFLIQKKLNKTDIQVITLFIAITFLTISCSPKQQTQQEGEYISDTPAEIPTPVDSAETAEPICDTVFYLPPYDSDMIRWKTYCNSKLGYELKYPPDWVFRQNEYDKTTMYFGEKGKMEDNGKMHDVFKVGFSVEIDTFSIDYRFYDREQGTFENHTSLKNGLLCGLGKDDSMLPIKFGTEGYEGYWLHALKGVGVCACFYCVYVQRGKILFRMEGYVPTPLNEIFKSKYNYDNIFYQILSTIKFVDKTNKKQL